MKRVLVILHIWYKDQVDYFISKLKNVNGCEWDLWVTIDTHDEAVEEKLRAFRSDVRIIEVTNIGYDIAPYIKVLQRNDLSGYDYILKLHTKREMPKHNRLNGVSLAGWRWRDHLVNSLLGSKSKFKRVLRKLNNPEVGMVCSYEMLKKLKNYLPEDSHMLKEEAERIGCRRSYRKFCAGAMFIVKREAQQRIISAAIDFSTWTKESKSHSTGTLAHVYERLITLAVADAGYKIACSTSSMKATAQATLYKAVHLFNR